MRYRDRTLGFSLDSDSTLLSVQASFTDANARSYTLTYHDAEISNPLNVPNRVSSWTNMATWGNVVTTAPVSINLVDARVSLPLTLGAYDVHLDFGGRLQDDQPRPDKGFLASIEVAMRIAL